MNGTGLRLMRVVLENAEYKEEEIRIDLLLEGDRVKRGLEYFGIWIDKEDDERSPFILGSDGKVDFGSGYDDTDRYHPTSILETNIREGEILTYGDDEEEYRIVGMTRLI